MEGCGSAAGLGAGRSRLRFLLQHSVQQQMNAIASQVMKWRARRAARKEVLQSVQWWTLEALQEAKKACRQKGQTKGGGQLEEAGLEDSVQWWTLEALQEPQKACRQKGDTKGGGQLEEAGLEDSVQWWTWEALQEEEKACRQKGETNGGGQLEEAGLEEPRLRRRQLRGGGKQTSLFGFFAGGPEGSCRYVELPAPKPKGRPRKLQPLEDSELAEEVKAAEQDMQALVEDSAGGCWPTGQPLAMPRTSGEALCRGTPRARRPCSTSCPRRRSGRRLWSP